MNVIQVLQLKLSLDPTFEFVFGLSSFQNIKFWIIFSFQKMGQWLVQFKVYDLFCKKWPKQKVIYKEWKIQKDKFLLIGENSKFRS